MKRRTPALADWVLECLGVSSRNDALIGDLSEEYAAGRSWLWYWGQTIAAVRTAVAGDLRRHAVLVIRSVVLSWTYFRVSILCYNNLIHWIQFESPWRSDFSIVHFVLGSCVIATLGGWLTVRMHKSQKAAVLAVNVFLYVLVEIWHIANDYDKYDWTTYNHFTLDLGAGFATLFSFIVGALLCNPSHAGLSIGANRHPRLPLS